MERHGRVIVPAVIARPAVSAAVLYAVLLVIASGCVGLLEGSCEQRDTCRCSDVGLCERQCVGEGCKFECEGSGDCLFECEDGGCDVLCEGRGHCTLACPGGKCSMVCSGTGSCALTECDTSCDIDCRTVGSCAKG